MSLQQYLDPLPQFAIGAALAVKDRSPVRSALLFDGGEKDGLNTLGIYRHGMSPTSLTPFSATSGRAVVEKREKSSPESVPQPGASVGPFLSGQVDRDVEHARA